MSESKVFRKVSLDRLSSPEELDQNVSIVPPIGWVALCALAALVAAALVWGVFGTVYKKVNGQGVLMYGSGIETVVAPTGGPITDISLQAGSRVEQGQVIARVSQDELIAKIRTSEEDLKALKGISVEDLELDPALLNSNLYPEFAQLAQQIRNYRVQKNGQALEYDKNLRDAQDRIELQMEQVRALEQQIEVAEYQLDEYIGLLEYQREVELDNARDQEEKEESQYDPVEGPVFSDDNGRYYKRTYRAREKAVVIDQANNRYTIFMDDDEDMENYPVLFINNAGQEVFNSQGRFFLPNYYNFTIGASSSGTIPNARVAKIYYGPNGECYIDRTGNELRRYHLDYYESNIYEQTRNRPGFDSTQANMESQIENLQLQLKQARAQLEQYQSAPTEHLLSSYRQIDEQIALLTEQFLETRQIKRQDLEKQLAELRRQADLGGAIVSPVSGKILEMNFGKGDFLQQGQVLCSVIKSTGAALGEEAIIYVSAQDGKKILEGMKVNVSPTTVNREEYGYILGVVKSVSDYVVSTEHMVNTLNNQQLAQMLAGESAPIEVRVELLRSNETASGYQWSTPRGAPTTIDEGTLCTCEINVDSQRPIDMVVPYLKKLFLQTQTGG